MSEPISITNPLEKLAVSKIGKLIVNVSGVEGPDEIYNDPCNEKS